jgi:hypothetical protein
MQESVINIEVELIFNLLINIHFSVTFMPHILGKFYVANENCRVIFGEERSLVLISMRVLSKSETIHVTCHGDL